MWKITRNIGKALAECISVTKAFYLWLSVLEGQANSSQRHKGCYIPNVSIFLSPAGGGEGASFIDPSYFPRTHFVIFL